jgi:hypothetical protein
MQVRRVGVFLGLLAMLVSGGFVLLRLLVLARIVMMGRFQMMVGRC